MNREKGITLISLVIYIVVSTIAIGIMSMISSNFFLNTSKIKNQNEYAEEFNKFNMFFINDVKNNSSAEITDTTIVFEDGNTYVYDSTEKNIKRNEIIIARNIQSIQFTQGTYEVNSVIKNLITVKMNIGKNNIFEKEIEYVLKYW